MRGAPDAAEIGADNKIGKGCPSSIRERGIFDFVIFCLEDRSYGRALRAWREFDVLRTLAEGKAHYTKRMECVIMGSIGMRRVGCKNGAAF